MLMVAAALAAALLRLAAVGSATNDSSTGPMPVPVPTALANHTADPYFPIYHVRPDDGWHTNDPNGPFFFRGVFHLFSQCRQMAAVMPIPPGGWCHYASKDLVKWRRLGYPLRPDRSYDNISLDTGSATIVDGVPTMLIPGVEKSQTAASISLALTSVWQLCEVPAASGCPSRCLRISAIRGSGKQPRSMLL
jgi:sucrose-6-phosphate hydrolase SacC (GH32 family)